MFPVRYDCFQIIYFLRVSKVLFTLILLYCTYIHFNLLSFYLVKSKASCNFCNVEDTIWVQEQTICSAVSIAVFSAPNRTILSKLNLLHSRLEDVYCKSFEVKVSKIEMPPHCFLCLLTNSQRVCCFPHWLPFLKAITHIQILLSISRSPKIVTVFFLATVCLKSDIFFFRYEVKFQQALECGGAYVKLLSKHDALDLVIVFRVLYAVS